MTQPGDHARRVQVLFAPVERARWQQQWKSGWWLRDAQGKWSRKAGA